MKTLYVADLDGTLLKSDQTISEATIGAIEKIVEQGDYFSYATARSYYTSSVVTKGLNINIPVIVYNGTMIIDQKDGTILSSRCFDEEEQAILTELIEEGVYPIVYSFQNGKEKFTYLPKYCSEGMNRFLATRKDSREIIGETLEDLKRGEMFHYTCIDGEKKLKPLYEKLKDRVPCVYYVDMYTKEYWLEIMPKGVSKASAIEMLKKELHCYRVVAFGDGKNDIPMFLAADEAYAVLNAHEELKQYAAGILKSNDEDGVAEYLKMQIK